MDDETRATPPDDAELDKTRSLPPDDAELGATRALPPDEAAADRTAVGPPPEEATRVLGGEAADATRVMPSAAPLGSSPTVTMTHRPSNRFWLWIVVVVLVVAALAVVWALLLRSSSDSAARDFVGTWMPSDGSGGGLVIKQTDGGLTVAAYDRQLLMAGTAEGDVKDGKLELTLPAAALGLEGADRAVTITYQSGSDRLLLVAALERGGPAELKRTYSRTDVLQPAQTTAPVPTSTPTPTPSPSTSGTASPSPSPSTSAPPDQQVIQGIISIQMGIQSWAAANNGVYPTQAEVSSTGGVAQYVDPWPTNPYSGQPMAPGTSQGDYTYEQLNAGQAYRLTGFLSNAQKYVVP